MSKSFLTEKIEDRVYHHFWKTGNFIAYEVQFGFHQRGDDCQYCDVVIYNTHKELTCIEIKVSVSDFHSKAKKTFVGHKNYYAMPLELYEKVKDEIPKEIGVYVLVQEDNTSYYDFYCIKKCRSCSCELDENTILWSIIRSRTNATTQKYVGG